MSGPQLEGRAWGCPTTASLEQSGHSPPGTPLLLLVHALPEQGRGNTNSGLSDVMVCIDPLVCILCHRWTERRLIVMGFSHQLLPHLQLDGFFSVQSLHRINLSGVGGG